MSIRRQEALDYHSQGRPGKIQVSPTKPFKNQRDLSLAYTPGVAEPCRGIAAHPTDAYASTATRDALSIPVFHDDQHGAAIITGAALLNALEIVKKDIRQVRVVFAGAGAAAVASAKHYVRLGVPQDQITLCDERGVLHADREDLDEYRRRFAVRGKARTLAEALRDADVFVGLSVGGIVTGEMLKSMAPRPIVFALANPDPEISPEEARRARSAASIATGRSDYPNQVNNVLGFPFIFCGALDVRAKKINEEMEMAATRAPASLAKEEGADSVVRAYGVERVRFR